MNEKFLEAYKRLENELRDEGISVLDYENSLEDKVVQEQLKLCRICRNYMAHNDMKFIIATKNMISFLEKLAAKIRLQSQLVKNEMKKTKPAYIGTPIKNILTQCSKAPVPIVDKKTGVFLFLADCEYLVTLLAKKETKIKERRRVSYNFVNSMAKISDLLENCVYVVTDNGKSDGKYIGILKI